MSALKNTGVVVLAAGASSRLGEPKQLVRFEGRPLVQRVIDACVPFGFTSRVLVLGADAERILEAVDLEDFTPAVNEAWSEGMAGSLRMGVASSLELNPDTGHLLFLLSDQPFVNGALLRELLEHHANGRGPITASYYKQQVGVPAIFPAEFFPMLEELEGDQGAKKILMRFREKVTPVPFEMGYFDLDTPEDYAALRRLES